MKESKIHATERLRREGRWDEASAFRDEQRRRLKAEGLPKAEANEKAWEAMIDNFAPLVADAQNRLLSDESKDAPISNDANEFEADALATQFAGHSTDLIADILWTYENLENRRARPQSATSLGAWSMLKWARDSRNRFFEQLLPKALAAREKESAIKDQSFEPDPGVEEIQQILRELSRSKSVTATKREPAVSTTNDGVHCRR